MARLFPPGATTTRTVPLLPMPAENSNVPWPQLTLTPTQIAQIKRGQTGWLLTESLGALGTSEVVINTPPGQAAPASARPRTAGPQVAQGQAAAVPTPTVNLAQAQQPLATGAFNQPTGALNQATGQLVGVAVQQRQQAAGGAQAIRVAGPMPNSGGTPAQAPYAPPAGQAPAGSGWGAGMLAPGAIGRAATPTMQLQRARPLARWAVVFGVLACVAAFAPLALHLLVIASAAIGLVALALGVAALRLSWRGAPEHRQAVIALTLGSIGLVLSVVLTLV